MNDKDRTIGHLLTLIEDIAENLPRRTAAGWVKLLCDEYGVTLTVSDCGRCDAELREGWDD